MYVKRPIELTVVQGRGDTDEDTYYNMRKLLNRAYIPNGILVYVSLNSDFNQLEMLPFFQGKLQLASPHANQLTRAYVCKNFVCSPPMLKFNELENYIA
jgi:uncharacterized protein YyaL (SSP411 family)